MKNFVISSVVLLAMAGIAFSEEPKQPPKELTVDFGKGVKLEMVLIPAGEFMMGSPDSDKNARDDEKPQHRVRITKPFYLPGNVWEWCQDWHGHDYYAQSPTDDPTGPTTGSRRVHRGGCWSREWWYCRSTFRDELAPVGGSYDVGLRVALVPADK